MKKTLKIDGMSCSHCEKRILNLLNELNIKVIEVSAQNKTATIEVSDENSLHSIGDSLSDLGFDLIEII